MTIEEYVNAIMKPLIQTRKPNLIFKQKLNAIYGKHIYNLSAREKEYIINDARSVISSYMFNRCCGKTWWLNSMYLDTDSVTIIEESEARKNARTILEFRCLNRKENKIG